MNRFDNITKPLMWFMALLLTAFIAGCGGGSSSSTPVPSLLNSAKSIDNFSLAWAAGTSVPPGTTSGGTATGTIDQTLKTITVPIPHRANITVLFATFTTSPGVSVTIGTAPAPVVTQVSGSTQNDYTNPVSYKVNAADGTWSTYTVIVNRDQTVTSLAVDPLTASTPKGATYQFAAMATYLDASIDDVTTTASWTSAASGVASFDTVGTPGLATGHAVGTSDITAAFSGQTAPAATLTVTNAALLSLAVSPATASVAAGSDQQFVANGTYTDGIPRVVAANWTSAASGVATVQTLGDATPGLATGHAVGTSVITATQGTVSNTADLTVTAPLGTNLGLAAPFASAAKSGLANVSATTINGNVLLDPNQTCNGATLTSSGDFTGCGGTAPTLGGTSKVISTLYTGGSNITTIKNDLNAAYLSITPLAGPPAVGSLGGGTTLATTTIGGARGAALVQGVNLFAPGIYTSGSAINVTGDITLDAGGNANALFYFQAGSALTVVAGGITPTNTRILLVGGAKASNVWWQVGASATIGTYAEFQGNVLAAVDVTMETGATACGRLLGGAWVGSSSGVATFGNNIISVPGQTFVPPVGYSTICQ